MIRITFQALLAAISLGLAIGQSTCPGAVDGTRVANSGGNAYQIYCANDFSGGAGVVTDILTFDACLIA